MKTLRILSLFCIAVFMFSCEKEMEKELKMTEVVFGIAHVEPLVVKDGHLSPICVEDMVPVRAEIDIDGTIYDLEIFELNGRLYTQAIKLPAKAGYEVKTCIVYNKDDVEIMATPLKNSTFADFVVKPVSFYFDCVDVEKLEVDIEVLCYTPALTYEFGFNWMEFQQIVVREMCFYGDLCIKDVDDYFIKGSPYIDDFIKEQYVFDLPALFEIRYMINGNELTSKTFSNINWIDDEWIFTGPLCIQYPDRINIRDVFTFELWVWVRVGDGFERKHFHTWTVVDDEKIITDEFGVVDFVIGNCLVDPAEEIFVFPPYMNLPVSAVADIDFDLEADGYWVLDIKSVDPVAWGYDFPTSGEYLGWCGDGYRNIEEGEHTFNIYSSLDNVLRPWPDYMPVTLQSLAKVNWLMNNLSDYGYPELTGMFVEAESLDISVQLAKDLQHAIWIILGFDPDNSLWPGTNQGGGAPSQDAKDMAFDAKDMGGFVPLPGGYAAILMVENDPVVAVAEPILSQLIFTMVDP